MLYGFMYNQMFFRVDKIFVICRFFYLKTSFLYCMTLSLANILSSFFANIRNSWSLCSWKMGWWRSVSHLAATAKSALYCGINISFRNLFASSTVLIFWSLNSFTSLSCKVWLHLSTLHFASGLLAKMRLHHSCLIALSKCVIISFSYLAFSWLTL